MLPPPPHLDMVLALRMLLPQAAVAVEDATVRRCGVEEAEEESAIPPQAIATGSRTRWGLEGTTHDSAGALALAAERSGFMWFSRQELLALVHAQSSVRKGRDAASRAPLSFACSDLFTTRPRRTLLPLRTPSSPTLQRKKHAMAFHEAMLCSIVSDSAASLPRERSQQRDSCPLHPC